MCSRLCNGSFRTAFDNLLNRALSSTRALRRYNFSGLAAAVLSIANSICAAVSVKASAFLGAFFVLTIVNVP